MNETAVQMGYVFSLNILFLQHKIIIKRIRKLPENDTIVYKTKTLKFFLFFFAKAFTFIIHFTILTNESKYIKTMHTINNNESPY